MTTLLYGSQTSLGRYYTQTRCKQSLFAVGGTSSVAELESAIRCASTMQITRVVCMDGINHLSKIGETSGDDLNILVRNAFMPYMLVNGLARHFESLRAVFVTSQTYKVPQRCTTLYCASKAALGHAVKVMSRELAPRGWRINALAPGKILDTKMAELTDAQVEQLRGWSSEEADRYALSMVPAGRFTNRKEVCDAIDWLLNAPDYITGTTIDMTGGV